MPGGAIFASKGGGRRKNVHAPLSPCRGDDGMELANPLVGKGQKAQGPWYWSPLQKGYYLEEVEIWEDSCSEGPWQSWA